MIVQPFQPEHLERLLLQPAQEYARPYLSDPAYAKALVLPGHSFTALDGDRVLACAGIIPLWEGRAEAWALMGRDLRAHFLAIHHATRRFLNACGMRRVEAAVDAQFGCAKGWIEALGFEEEGVLRAYTPDGRDCIRYARVRHG
jgi:hypothetical protein